MLINHRIPLLFASVRDKVLSLFQSDISEALLTSVTCRILFFDNKLYNLETGQNITCNDLGEEEIAQKVSGIVKKEQQDIALFLPATEFISTPYHLPAINTNDVHSVLSYQQSELIPALDNPLILAVNHRVSSIEPNIALWFNKEYADSLHYSFSKKGLSLLMVAPSIMSMDCFEKKQNIYEETNDYFLYVEFVENSLKTWGLFYKSDMQLKAIADKWDILTKQNPLHENKILRDPTDFEFPKLNNLHHCHYVFFPEKARNINKKSSRVRTGRVSMIASLFILLLISSPFIVNQVRYHQEKQKYDLAYEKSREVRKMKAYVLSSEESWTSHQQFPVINLVDVLKSLEKLIPKNSWLISLSYDQGKLEIKGNSANPTEVLQLISHHEAYKNVAFSQNIRIDRGKKNELFGISFELDALNYEQYKEQYFPELMILD